MQTTNFIAELNLEMRLTHDLEGMPDHTQLK